MHVNDSVDAIHTQVLVVGHVCMDITMHVTHVPDPDHKQSASHMSWDLGGNAARVMHQLQQQGVISHMISVLGSETDVITQLCLQHMQSWPKWIHHVCEPGAVSQVWCDHQDRRTIVSYQPKQIVESELPHVPEIHAKVALFDNHRWRLVNQIRQQLADDCVQILDMDAIMHKKDLHVLQGFDQIWFSKESYDHMGMSLISLAQELHTPVVGFTQGALPVVWASQGEIHMWQPPHIKHVKHTLGAGDAFRAGLAHAVLQGLDEEQSVRAACEWAAQHIQDLT